jgi:hypothetical protein
MLSTMANEPELSPDDPLGLKRFEREIRVERLRQEINEVTGGEFLTSKDLIGPPSFSALRPSKTRRPGYGGFKSPLWHALEQYRNRGAGHETARHLLRGRAVTSSRRFWRLQPA